MAKTTRRDVVLRSAAAAGLLATDPIRPVAAPAEMPPAIRGGKGLCCGSLIGLSPSELNATLDDLSSLGTDWIRFDFDWNVIQLRSGAEFRLDRFEAVVSGCVSRGIGIIGIIAYRAIWSPPSGAEQFVPPARIADYAGYAQGLARHFKGRIACWEIWNEANLGGVFWKPAADPVAYTALLRSAYRAIKAEDPLATVLACGTAPAPDNALSWGWKRWYEAIYAAGGGDFFDAVATHPYTPSLPSAADGSAHWWEQSRTVHDVLRANRDDRKTVWMTEFGRATGGPDSATEDMQAAIVQEAYRLHAAIPWAGPLILYEYRDSGVSPETSENFFGIRRADGSEKPAYRAFRNVPSRRALPVSPTRPP